MSAGEVAQLFDRIAGQFPDFLESVEDQRLAWDELTQMLQMFEQKVPESDIEAVIARHLEILKKGYAATHDLVQPIAFCTCKLWGETE